MSKMKAKLFSIQLASSFMLFGCSCYEASQCINTAKLPSYNKVARSLNDTIILASYQWSIDYYSFKNLTASQTYVFSSIVADCIVTRGKTNQIVLIDHIKIYKSIIRR
jgi:hypothetical protein